MKLYNIYNSDGKLDNENSVREVIQDLMDCGMWTGTSIETPDDELFTIEYI